MLTIHDGSTARGDGDTGDFMMVRVTDKKLIVIHRKLGGWEFRNRPLLELQRDYPSHEDFPPRGAAVFPSPFGFLPERVSARS